MDKNFSFAPPPARKPSPRTAAKPAEPGSTTRSASKDADAEELKKPLAIIAEADDKIRGAVCEILRRAGFRTTPVSRGATLVDKVKQNVPSLLVVGVDLNGVDVCGLLRIVSRFHETRPVRVVVTFPPESSTIQMQSAVESGAFSTLLRPLKTREILQAGLAAMKSSEEERARMDAATRGKPPVARHVETNNSLLVRKISCPFHPEALSFDRFTLRGSKIMTESNLFDITVYKRAAPGAQFINFHQLAVMICPKCLFASNHSGYFHDPVSEEEPDGSRHAHNDLTKEGVAISANDRWGLFKQRLGKLSPGFFTETRTLTEAIFSYELAIECSKILVTCARDRVPMEFLRAGNYYLRLAHLHELAGHSAETIEECYRAAVPLLEQAYTVATGAHLFKAAYQMMALSVYFGDDKIAYQYLAQMNEFDRDRELPNEERCALQKYLPRAQRLWEDRDTNRAVPLETASTG